MIRFIFCILLACISTVNAATDRAIGVSVTGTGSGLDWNNQTSWAAIASNGFIRGDTYYVADGSYGGKILNTPASGTTTITIKKATVSSHGPSTGWNNAFGDGVATFSSSIKFDSGYWVFDGVTGGGPGSWTTGFGFKINVTGAASGPGIRAFRSTATGVAPNITMRHVEIQGNGGDGQGSPANDGINIFSGCDNFVLSYAYIHDMGRCPLFINANNGLIEYLYTGPFEGGVQHSEIMSTNNQAVNKVNDGTIRYCVFTHFVSTGGLLINGARWKIYGNVFHNITNPGFAGANGMIGGWSWGSTTDCEVYNNVFALSNVTIGGQGAQGGNIARNNLFYDADITWPGGWTHTHNHYVSLRSAIPTEATRSTGTGSPFVSYGGGNYHLVNATPTGQTLASPFTSDADGVTRGSDGVWDRGAYELGGAGQPGSISIASATYSLSEAGGNMAFVLERTGGSTGTVGVSYATSDGSAAQPGDYTSTSGTQSWTSGDAADKTINVPIVSDADVEGNQTLLFTISSPTGGASLGSITQATGTIIDDESATIPLMGSLSFGAEEGLIEPPYTTTSGKISQTTNAAAVAQGGRASYRFTTSAGDHKITLGVNAPVNASDTVWVEVDGEPTEPADVNDISPLTSGVQARDVKQRGTGTWSAPQFAPKIWTLTAGEHTLRIVGREPGVEIDTVTITDLNPTDTTAPAPNPPTWLQVPFAQVNDAISMEVNSVSDQSPPVEYYFDETLGNPGATDSGWQSETTYTDDGLIEGTEYRYQVKARDALLNETTFSTLEIEFTDEIGGAQGGTINTQNLTIGQ